MNNYKYIRVLPSAIVPTAVPFNMNEYEYVSPKEWEPVKNEIIGILNKTQNLIRKNFTFRYDFIGSAKRNMITIKVKDHKNSKILHSCDFDINKKSRSLFAETINNIYNM